MVHLDADLAVTLPADRPGTLAAALRCVGDAGINLDGYAEIGGVVHVLSEELQAAHDCLQKGGFRIVQEQQVLVVAVEDEPGAAAGVYPDFRDIGAQTAELAQRYMAVRSPLPDENPRKLDGTRG